MNSLDTFAAKIPGAALLALAIAPAYVAGLLGHGSYVSFGIVAAIPAFVLGMMAGFELVFIMAVPTSLLAVGATAGSTNALLGAAVLAVGAFLMNVTVLRPGGTIYLMQVIFLATWLVAPPLLEGKDPTAGGNLLALGLTELVIVLWVGCIGASIHAKRSSFAMPSPTVRVAVASGIAGALVLGVTAWFVVDHKLGHAGFWLLLTVCVVFHPFVPSPWTKAFHRIIGTLLGFAIVFAIVWILPADAPSWAFLVPAIVFGYAMLTVLMSPTGSSSSYWLAVTFLTPMIVLLTGSTTKDGRDEAIRTLDISRLEATIAGVAIALVCIAILYPFRDKIIAAPKVVEEAPADSPAVSSDSH